MNNGKLGGSPGLPLRPAAAVGLALLACMPFVAVLDAIIWRAGQAPLGVALGLTGAVFLAMGFASTAAETALIGESVRS